MTKVKSEFVPYAFGYAAEDKEPDAMMLKVHILEHVPGLDSELDTEGKDKQEVASTGSLGVSVGSVDKGTVIEAAWLPEENRMVPPTVKQGESIQIYRFGESDKFYWQTHGYNKDLRRKEVYVIGVSNLDKEESFGELFDADTSYWLRFDSIGKNVQLHIADNDKEASGYDMTFDSKKGVFSLVDTHKNSIVLNSPKGVLTFTVPTINHKCTTLNVDASSAVNINTPNMTVAGGAVTMNSTVKFNKGTDFRAPVKMNGNARTSKDKHGQDTVIL